MVCALLVRDGLCDDFRAVGARCNLASFGNVGSTPADEPFGGAHHRSNSGSRYLKLHGRGDAASVRHKRLSLAARQTGGGCLRAATIARRLNILSAARFAGRPAAFEPDDWPDGGARRLRRTGAGPDS